jgi:hypothetical protein
MHAPGGPIAAFPILDSTPGQIVKPPAPVPNPSDMVGGAQDFLTTSCRWWPRRAPRTSAARSGSKKAGG